MSARASPSQPDNAEKRQDAIYDSLPAAIRASSAVDTSAGMFKHFRINAPPTDRPVRIYCDGIYDMFHYGHAKSLEQAKKAFPSVFLLVGVCNDDITNSKKGKTVMKDKERYESVRHCKWADEVVEDAPWIITQEFIDKHQIDYIAHDDIPYQSGDCADVYEFVKQQGKFLPTRRTEGVSTSDLITRIVHDYDVYLRRNLARGVSPKELNISFIKEKRLQIGKTVDELKDEIKTEFNEWKDEWKETLRTWEEKSNEFVRGFTTLFQSGPTDIVSKLFRRSLSPLRSPDGAFTFGGKRSRRSSLGDHSGDDHDDYVVEDVKTPEKGRKRHKSDDSDSQENVSMVIGVSSSVGNTASHAYSKTPQGSP